MKLTILVFSFLTLGLHAKSPLAEHLTSEKIGEIRKLLGTPLGGKNLEQHEKTYQRLVQRQTFADLIKVYAPENADKLEITYPSFIPEGGKPGKDLGFGLHVVKRLTLVLEGGDTKVIDVNEAWPEDRQTGGLFFPDEIRVKTRVFQGDRFVPGSERLYLFDSIRLAWGSTRELSLHRRTRYTYEEDRRADRRKQMRVPVSAPVSCAGCHRAGNVFTRDFLEDGETVNHEAIVQNRYFKRRLEETRGFQDYLDHLGDEGRESDFIADVERALLDPRESMKVPGFTQALEQSLDNYSWLSDDEEFVRPELFPLLLKRQGVYQKDSSVFVDAVEEVIEGKYRWWFPQTVIPGSFRRPRK